LDGEDKPHIYSARAFVGWYNGLPEYRDLNPDLTAGETAVVVGQGNVALDVARTLLSKTDVLKKTDMTEYAIEALSKSSIRHVHVVGRRGPMQAAFTIKEVRELLNLEGVNFTPIPQDLFPRDLKKLPRPKRRLLELLPKGGPQNPNAIKTWSLDFLLAPKSLVWNSHDPSKLHGIEFTKMTLENPDSPDSKVSSTEETTTLPTSTLFRSIGYKAEAIPGMEELGAHFNDGKGMISHDGMGRIKPLGSVPPSGRPDNQASLYCSGWVKRGPTGVIASTMTDAFQTAEAIVEDWKKAYANPDLIEAATKAMKPERLGWKGVERDARTLKLEIKPVHWEDWGRIDEIEMQAGKERGKPREKFARVEEMLRASSQMA
jgi:adrenodoxin-NADP+ reductase